MRFPFLRVGSTLLAGVFIFQTIAAPLAEANQIDLIWNQRRLSLTTSLNEPLPAAPRPAVTPKFITGDAAFTVSPSLGSILERWSPENPTAASLVVHVQDVHNHPAVQMNIARMIREIQSKAGSDVVRVGVEGAWQDLDFSPYRSVPANEWREMTVRAFLEKNALSGAHYAAMTDAEGTLRLSGLEKKDTYLENLLVRDRSEADRRRLIEAFQFLRARFDRLSRHVLPAAVREIRHQQRRYREGQLRLEDYLGFLTRGRPDLREFSEIRRLLEIEGLRRDLDENNVNEARSRLTARLLAPKIGANAPALVEASNAFRDGRLSASGFYRALIRVAGEAGIDVPKEVTAVAAYLKFQESLSPEKLIEELERLEGRVLDNASRTVRGYADLAQFLAQADRVERQEEFWSLKLTPSMVDRIGATDVDWREAERFLSRLEFSLGLKPAMGVIPTGYEKTENDVRKFYALAKERDAIMAERIAVLAKAAGRSGGPVVLIAGGFHSRGLTERLRQSRIPYAVVQPTMEAAAREKNRVRLVGRLPDPWSLLADHPLSAALVDLMRLSVPQTGGDPVVLGSLNAVQRVVAGAATAEDGPAVATKSDDGVDVRVEPESVSPSLPRPRKQSWWQRFFLASRRYVIVSYLFELVISLASPALGQSPNNAPRPTGTTATAPVTDTAPATRPQTAPAAARSERAEERLNRLRGWIAAHRAENGLPYSNIGDRQLVNVAFTYDIMIAAQYLLAEGKIEEAKQLLKTFDATVPKRLGGYINAVRAGTGGPFENNVTFGPNMHVGLSALAVWAADGGASAELFAMALDQGEFLLKNINPDGSVPFGPPGPDQDFDGVPYGHVFNPEYQVDAYGLLNRLWLATGDVRFRDAAQRALDYLIDKHYGIVYNGEDGVRRKFWAINDRQQRGYPMDVPGWAMSMIGPEKLAEKGVDIADVVRDLGEIPEFFVTEWLANRANGLEIGIAYLRARGMAAEVAQAEKDLARLRTLLTGLPLVDGQKPSDPAGMAYAYRFNREKNQWEPAEGQPTTWGWNTQYGQSGISQFYIASLLLGHDPVGGEVQGRPIDWPALRDRARVLRQAIRSDAATETAPATQAAPATQQAVKFKPATTPTWGFAKAQEDLHAARTMAIASQMLTNPFIGHHRWGSNIYRIFEDYGSSHEFQSREEFVDYVKANPRHNENDQEGIFAALNLARQVDEQGLILRRGVDISGRLGRVPPDPKQGPIPLARYLIIDPDQGFKIIEQLSSLDEYETWAAQRKDIDPQFASKENLAFNRENQFRLTVTKSGLILAPYAGAVIVDPVTNEITEIVPVGGERKFRIYFKVAVSEEVYKRWKNMSPGSLENIGIIGVIEPGEYGSAPGHYYAWMYAPNSDSNVVEMRKFEVTGVNPDGTKQGKIGGLLYLGFNELWQVGADRRASATIAAYGFYRGMAITKSAILEERTPYAHLEPGQVYLRPDIIGNRDIEGNAYLQSLQRLMETSADPNVAAALRAQYDRDLIAYFWLADLEADLQARRSRAAAKPAGPERNAELNTIDADLKKVLAARELAWIGPSQEHAFPAGIEGYDHAKALLATVDQKIADLRREAEEASEADKMALENSVAVYEASRADLQRKLARSEELQVHRVTARISTYERLMRQFNRRLLRLRQRMTAAENDEERMRLYRQYRAEARTMSFVDDKGYHHALVPGYEEAEWNYLIAERHQAMRQGKPVPPLPTTVPEGLVPGIEDKVLPLSRAELYRNYSALFPEGVLDEHNRSWVVVRGQTGVLQHIMVLGVDGNPLFRLEGRVRINGVPLENVTSPVSPTDTIEADFYTDILEGLDGTSAGERKYPFGRQPIVINEFHVEAAAPTSAKPYIATYELAPGVVRVVTKQGETWVERYSDPTAENPDALLLQREFIDGSAESYSQHVFNPVSGEWIPGRVQVAGLTGVVEERSLMKDGSGNWMIDPVTGRATYRVETKRPASYARASMPSSETATQPATQPDNNPMVTIRLHIDTYETDGQLFSREEPKSWLAIPGNPASRIDGKNERHYFDVYRQRAIYIATGQKVSIPLVTVHSDDHTPTTIQMPDFGEENTPDHLAIEGKPFVVYHVEHDSYFDGELRSMSITEVNLEDSYSSSENSAPLPESVRRLAAEYNAKIPAGLMPEWRITRLSIKEPGIKGPWGELMPDIRPDEREDKQGVEVIVYQASDQPDGGVLGGQELMRVYFGKTKEGRFVMKNGEVSGMGSEIVPEKVGDRRFPLDPLRLVGPVELEGFLVPNNLDIRGPLADAAWRLYGHSLGSIDENTGLLPVFLQFNDGSREFHHEDIFDRPVRIERDLSGNTLRTLTGQHVTVGTKFKWDEVQRRWILLENQTFRNGELIQFGTHIDIKNLFKQVPSNLGAAQSGFQIYKLNPATGKFGWTETLVLDGAGNQLATITPDPLYLDAGHQVINILGYADEAGRYRNRVETRSTYAFNNGVVGGELLGQAIRRDPRGIIDLTSAPSLGASLADPNVDFFEVQDKRRDQSWYAFFDAQHKSDPIARVEGAPETRRLHIPFYNANFESIGEDTYEMIEQKVGHKIFESRVNTTVNVEELQSELRKQGFTETAESLKGAKIFDITPLHYAEPGAAPGPVKKITAAFNKFQEILKIDHGLNRLSVKLYDANEPWKDMGGITYDYATGHLGEVLGVSMTLPEHLDTPASRPAGVAKNWKKGVFVLDVGLNLPFIEYMRGDGVVVGRDSGTYMNEQDEAGLAEKYQQRVEKLKRYLAGRKWGEARSVLTDSFRKYSHQVWTYGRFGPYSQTYLETLGIPIESDSYLYDNGTVRDVANSSSGLIKLVFKPGFGFRIHSFRHSRGEHAGQSLVTDRIEISDQDGRKVETVFGGADGENMAERIKNFKPSMVFRSFYGKGGYNLAKYNIAYKTINMVVIDGQQYIFQISNSTQKKPNGNVRYKTKRGLSAAPFQFNPSEDEFDQYRRMESVVDQAEFLALIDSFIEEKDPRGSLIRIQSGFSRIGADGFVEDGAQAKFDIFMKVEPESGALLFHEGIPVSGVTYRAKPNASRSDYGPGDVVATLSDLHLREDENGRYLVYGASDRRYGPALFGRAFTFDGRSFFDSYHGFPGQPSEVRLKYSPLTIPSYSVGITDDDQVELWHTFKHAALQHNGHRYLIVYETDPLKTKVGKALYPVEGWIVYKDGVFLAKAVRRERLTKEYSASWDFVDAFRNGFAQFLGQTFTADEVKEAEDVIRIAGEKGLFVQSAPPEELVRNMSLWPSIRRFLINNGIVLAVFAMIPLMFAFLWRLLYYFARPVNLNTADADELKQYFLPEEVSWIISLRREVGAFHQPEEIADVNPRKFHRVRSKLTVVSEPADVEGALVTNQHIAELLDSIRRGDVLENEIVAPLAAPIRAFMRHRLLDMDGVSQVVGTLAGQLSEGMMTVEFLREKILGALSRRAYWDEGFRFRPEARAALRNEMRALLRRAGFDPSGFDDNLHIEQKLNMIASSIPMDNVAAPIDRGWGDPLTSNGLPIFDRMPGWEMSPLEDFMIQNYIVPRFMPFANTNTAMAKWYGRRVKEMMRDGVSPEAIRGFMERHRSFWYRAITDQMIKWESNHDPRIRGTAYDDVGRGERTFIATYLQINDFFRYMAGESDMELSRRLPAEVTGRGDYQEGRGHGEEFLERISQGDFEDRPLVADEIQSLVETNVRPIVMTVRNHYYGIPTITRERGELRMWGFLTRLIVTPRIYRLDPSTRTYLQDKRATLYWVFGAVLGVLFTSFILYFIFAQTMMFMPIPFEVPLVGYLPSWTSLIFVALSLAPLPDMFLLSYIAIKNLMEAFMRLFIGWKYTFARAKTFGAALPLLRQMLIEHPDRLEIVRLFVDDWYSDLWLTDQEHVEITQILDGLSTENPPSEQSIDVLVDAIGRIRLSEIREEIRDWVNMYHRGDVPADPTNYGELRSITVQISGHGSNPYIRFSEMNTLAGGAFQTQIGMIATTYPEPFRVFVDRMRTAGAVTEAQAQELLSLIDDPVHVLSASFGNPENDPNCAAARVEEFINMRLNSGYPNIRTAVKLRRVYEHHIRGFFPELAAASNRGDPAAIAEIQRLVNEKVQFVIMHQIVAHGVLAFLRGVFRDTEFAGRSLNEYMHLIATGQLEFPPSNTGVTLNGVGYYAARRWVEFLSQNNVMFLHGAKVGQADVHPWPAKYVSWMGSYINIQGEVIMALDWDHRHQIEQLWFYPNALREFDISSRLGVAVYSGDIMTRGVSHVGNVMGVMEEGWLKGTLPVKNEIGGVGAYGKFFFLTAAVRNSEGLPDEFVAEDIMTALRVMTNGFTTMMVSYVRVLKGLSTQFIEALKPLMKWSGDSGQVVYAEIFTKFMWSLRVHVSKKLDTVKGMMHYIKKPSVFRVTTLVLINFYYLNLNPWYGIPFALMVNSIILSQAIGGGAIIGAYVERYGWIRGLALYAYHFPWIFMMATAITPTYAMAVKLGFAPFTKFILTGGKGGPLAKARFSDLYIAGQYSVIPGFLLTILVLSSTFDPTKFLIWSPQILTAMVGWWWGPFFLNHTGGILGVWRPLAHAFVFAPIAVVLDAMNNLPVVLKLTGIPWIFGFRVFSFTRMLGIDRMVRRAALNVRRTAMQNRVPDAGLNNLIRDFVGEENPTAVGTPGIFNNLGSMLNGSMKQNPSVIHLGKVVKATFRLWRRNRAHMRQNPPDQGQPAALPTPTAPRDPSQAPSLPRPAPSPRQNWATHPDKTPVGLVGLKWQVAWAGLLVLLMQDVVVAGDGIAVGTANHWPAIILLVGSAIAIRMAPAIRRMLRRTAVVEPSEPDVAAALDTLYTAGEIESSRAFTAAADSMDRGLVDRMTGLLQRFWTSLQESSKTKERVVHTFKIDSRKSIDDVAKSVEVLRVMRNDGSGEKDYVYFVSPALAAAARERLTGNVVVIPDASSATPGDRLARLLVEGAGKALGLPADQLASRRYNLILPKDWADLVAPAMPEDLSRFVTVRSVDPNNPLKWLEAMLSYYVGSVDQEFFGRFGESRSPLDVFHQAARLAMRQA